MGRMIIRLDPVERELANTDPEVFNAHMNIRLAEMELEARMKRAELRDRLKHWVGAAFFFGFILAILVQAVTGHPTH